MHKMLCCIILVSNDDRGGWVCTIGVLEDCTDRIIVQLNDYWMQYMLVYDIHNNICIENS